LWEGDGGVIKKAGSRHWEKNAPASLEKKGGGANTGIGLVFGDGTLGKKRKGKKKSDDGFPTSGCSGKERGRGRH